MRKRWYLILLFLLKLIQEREMKKRNPMVTGLKLLTIGATIVLFTQSGCVKKKASPATQSTTQTQPVIECPYPDDPSVAAPTWICDEPIPGWQVSAVGSSPKSNAGSSYDKEMAIATARTELARSMRIHVKSMIKLFVRKTGVAESGTVDAMNESVTKQITKETLYGSRVVKSRTSPKGTSYVVVGMDTQTVVENAKEAIRKAKTSMKDSEAKYQTLEAEKSLEDLEKNVKQLNSELPPTTKGDE
jgi:hypothetical protein